ncbi:hypothetical protein [Microbacterium sp. TPU 3598]|uniref:hypothetical protein n=1 Tax=Microbacterium sp. TPU 3598 TaxID=1938334 RepID=UPI000BBA5E30|nr:hypothetical protein [Microbacterium sp. TPU 3598]
MKLVSMLTPVVLALGGVSVAAVPVSAAPPPDSAYQVTYLDAPSGFDSTFAVSIGEAGVVVGGAVATSTRDRAAVRWGDATAPEVLLVEGSHRGGVALDANARGVAVGTADGGAVGVVWDESGAGALLPRLEAGPSTPAGVSDAGVVVANGFLQSWRKQPFLVTHDGIERLPLPHSAHGQAVEAEVSDIADDDTVVGWAEIEHDDHDDAAPAAQTFHAEPVLQASLWRHGEATTLESPGGIESDSIANAVNPSGASIGGMAVVDGVECPVLWDSGKPRVLPLPEGRFSGWVTAVNDTGLAVGSIVETVAARNVESAALWRGSELVRLDDAVVLPEGHRMIAANDVNSRGQVAGVVATPEGERGVVLTPRPAPRLTQPLSDETRIVYGDPLAVRPVMSDHESAQVLWEAGDDLAGPWVALKEHTAAALEVTAAGAVALDGQWVRATFSNGAGQVTTNATRVRVDPAATAFRLDTESVSTKRGSPAVIEGVVSGRGLAGPTGLVTATHDGAVLAEGNLVDGRFTLRVVLDSSSASRDYDVDLHYAGDQHHQPAHAHQRITVDAAHTHPGNAKSTGTGEHLAATGADARMLIILVFGAGAAVMIGAVLRRRARTPGGEEVS